MTVARRIAAHFVAPADEHAADRRARSGPRPPADDAGRPPADDAGRGGFAGARTPASHRPPPAVALLAPPADAPSLGAALALALARAERRPVAVLCVWSPQPARSGWRAPPMPAAARLASALTARGHDATPAGRLAVVRLSPDGAEAASQALRVGAAAGAAPTVLALAGPRAAAFDELLAMQDLVVVAVAPPRSRRSRALPPPDCSAR